MATRSDPIDVSFKVWRILSKMPGAVDTGNVVYNNLICAEKTLLLCCGWEEVPQGYGKDSLWRNPRYALTYARNHAVLIEKSTNPNLGIY